MEIQPMQAILKGNFEINIFRSFDKSQSFQL